MEALINALINDMIDDELTHARTHTQTLYLLDRRLNDISWQNVPKCEVLL